MNELNMTCGCQGCGTECNCGCQAASAPDSPAQEFACGCGETCGCDPCRCLEEAR